MPVLGATARRALDVAASCVILRRVSACRAALAGSRLRRPTGQVSRQVGAGAAGRDPTVANCVGPGEPPGGQKYKRDRIGLDHVRRGAPGMGRPFDTLNRAKRWNPHLHRTAGYLLSKRGEQHPDRVAEQRAIRKPCCVKRLNGGGHRVRFGTTRGHDRTIRFDRRAQTAGPGSREGPWTRHSCLRYVLHVSGSAEYRKGRGREYAPTCVDYSRWCRSGCGSSGPLRHRLPSPRCREANHHDH